MEEFLPIMGLKLFGEIEYSSSAFIRDGVAANGFLYFIDSTNFWSKVDIKNLFRPIAVATVSGTAGISLISSASAIIVSSSSTTLDLVELSAGYRQNYSGGAVTGFSTKGQLVAGDPTTLIAFACSNTNSEVVKMNGNTFTVSRPTPSALSGAKATSIITKPGGNAWILGTNNGLIIEIDNAGASVKTITLPTTPNTGTAPTFTVTGLTMYGDILMCTTSHGAMFIYQYSSSTVLYKNLMCPARAASLGNTLCDSSSGYCLYGSNQNSSVNSSMGLSLINLTSSPPLIEDTQVFFGAGEDVVASGFDPSISKAFVLTSANSPVKIKIFDLDVSTCNIQTRSQDPAGADVASRIIRILDSGPGRSAVVADQNVGAGAVNVSSTKERTYYEISIQNGKWDARVTSS